MALKNTSLFKHLDTCLSENNVAGGMTNGMNLTPSDFEVLSGRSYVYTQDQAQQEY